MDNFQPLEQLLKKQKDAFDEIIYYLTEPGVAPGQRANRLAVIKKRANEILGSLVTEKRRRTDPSEISQIDAFIRECTARYKQEMERATDAMVGSEPAPDFDVPQVTSYAKPPKPTQSAPEIPFATQTVDQYNHNKKATALNISTHITVLDGENIPTPEPAEMFYVLSPYTKNDSVQVVRFVNSSAVTQYVYNEYRNDTIQPLIFFGKLAQVKFSINLEI